MKKLFSTLLILLLLPSSLVLAEDDDFPTYVCVDKMADEGGLIVDDYEAFAAEYVQEDTPTSGQVEVLTSFYRYVRYALQEIFNEYTQFEDGRPIELAKDEVNSCAFYRDQYLAYTEAILQSYVLGANSSKVSFKTTDALKEIVRRMEDYALVQAQVFPASFDGFNNALPCYAAECI